MSQSTTGQRTIPDDVLSMLGKGARKINVSVDLIDGATIEGRLVEAYRWPDLSPPLDHFGVIKGNRTEAYFPASLVKAIRIENNGGYETVYSA